MENSSIDTYTKDAETLEKKPMNKVEVNDLDYVKVKLSKVKFALIYTSLVLSLVMSSLDITIISTALPRISSEFHAYESFTWIITAYMLTNTAIQPMFGKFADIFGRKFMIVLTLSLFVVSSFICGAAPNIGVLILGRAIQGIGGGGVSVLVNIIIADIIPLRKRGLFMGINGAIFSFSSVVGPLLGGFFTDKITWRWAFYINVPIGIVCLILIIFFFKMPKEEGSLSEKIKRIDFAGTFSVIGSLVCLLLGLNWGGQKYPWSSTIIISLFAVGFFLLVVYIVIECKFAREPITPPELFKYRNITAPCITSFFNGMAFLTCVNTLPLLYQDGRGLSATNAGLRMTPCSFCITISAILSGILIGKWGHIDKYIKGGSFLMIFSTYTMTLIDVNTPYYLELIYYIFFGLTVGLIFQNCIMVAQQISPPEYLAISTTLISFFNTIGAVVGVAIHGALLQNFFPSCYKKHFPQENPVTVNDIHQVKNGPAIYVEALRKTYLFTIVPAAVVVFISAVFIKYYRMTGNKDKAVMDGEGTEMTKIENGKDQDITSSQKDVNLETEEITVTVVDDRNSTETLKL